MMVEDFHVLQPQAFKADIEFPKKFCSGRSFSVKTRGSVLREAHFGTNHERISRPTLNHSSDRLLISSSHITMRSIEKPHARIQGSPDEIGVIGVHDSHIDHRKFKSRPPQSAINKLPLFFL